MSVLVHTCQQAGDDSESSSKVANRTFVRNIGYLKSTRHYYTTDPKFESFKPLPKKCTCRKYVSNLDAETFLSQGKARLIYKPKDGERLSEKHIDFSQIIMIADRSQTPRVDMVTKADIERAYNKLSDPFFYPKFRNLEDAWNALGKFEDAPYGFIESVHLMVLEERSKLIADFRKDPDEMYDRKGRLLPGRILFPFGPDQRTAGGHS